MLARTSSAAERETRRALERESAMLAQQAVADDAEKKIVQQARCACAPACNTCASALISYTSTHIRVLLPLSHQMMYVQWACDRAQEADPWCACFDVHVLDGLEPRT